MVRPLGLLGKEHSRQERLVRLEDNLEGWARGARCKKMGMKAEEISENGLAREECQSVTNRTHGAAVCLAPNCD